MASSVGKPGQVRAVPRLMSFTAPRLITGASSGPDSAGTWPSARESGDPSGQRPPRGRWRRASAGRRPPGTARAPRSPTGARGREARLAARRSWNRRRSACWVRPRRSRQSDVRVRTPRRADAGDRARREERARQVAQPALFGARHSLTCGRVISMGSPHHGVGPRKGRNDLESRTKGATGREQSNSPQSRWWPRVGASLRAPRRGRGPRASKQELQYRKSQLQLRLRNETAA